MRYKNIVVRVCRENCMAKNEIGQCNLYDSNLKITELDGEVYFIADDKCRYRKNKNMERDINDRMLFPKEEA